MSRQLTEEIRKRLEIIPNPPTTDDLMWMAMTLGRLTDQVERLEGVIQERNATLLPLQEQLAAEREAATTATKNLHALVDAAHADHGQARKEATDDTVVTQSAINYVEYLYNNLDGG